MYGMKRKLAVLAVSAALMCVCPGNAWADEVAQTTGGWINMELGPGVAQWVDEQGNVTEEPGVKPEDAMAGTGGTAEAGSGASASDTGVTGPAEVGPGVETSGETAAEESQSGRVVDPARPMVALTFDDGPHAAVGNRIMDCLAQYGGKATFYVVGNRCAGNGTEMQRMVSEGHEIGNHTYSHKYLNQLGAAEIQSQIQKGVEAIQASAGAAPATVRLPGGNKNSTVLANVNAPMIMWSIDTLDWKTRNAQNTIDCVLSKVQDGDIILMHELYSATADAVEQLVPALIERGYQLVTVSEMAQCRGGLENGKIYYNFYPQN